MNYAIIKIQGHQEIVNAKTENLTIDRVTQKEGEIIKPSVLLAAIDGKIQVGTPTIDFPVELQVVQHIRGEKLYIQKFHAKARYRRRTGFRAEQTVLKIVKFGAEKLDEKKTKQVSVEKPAKLAKPEKEKKIVKEKKPRKTAVKAVKKAKTAKKN